MWVLKHQGTGEAFYLLHTKVKYSVGRMGSSLVLQDDTSISRSHAFLHLEGKTLKLEDAGSKYGTFVNEGIDAKKRLKQNTKITLNDGDRIQFGLLQNTWKVEHLQYKCLVSSMTEKEKEIIATMLAELGGEIATKWEDDCTHLAMNEVTVTVKLVQALIKQIPIVTIRYWADLRTAVSAGQSTLPAIDEYRPQIGALLKEINGIDHVELGKRSERQVLFQGKTFVFLNRSTLETYAPIVSAAGAAYKDLKSGVSKTFLAKKDVIVVEYVPMTQSQGAEVVNSLLEYVVSQGLRTVHHSEIGLAVLLCSTEKYCNPSYKGFNQLEPAEELDQQQSPDMAQYLTTKLPPADESMMTQAFVPETEEAQTDPRQKSTADECVIPESCRIEFEEPMNTAQSDADALNKSEKRKRSVDQMTQDLISALVKDDELAGDNDLFGCSAPKRAHREDPAIDSVMQPSTAAATSVDEALETSLSQPSQPNRCIRGFIHRSSPQKKKPANPAVSKPQTGEKRKRGHIGIVGEDEEDDENLFDFIGSDGDSVGMRSPSRAKKSKRDTNACLNTSDDELFGFTGAKDPKKSSNNENAVLSENSNSSTSRQQPPAAVISVLPKVVPKPRPIKVTADGWLSKKMQEIKVEADSSDDKMIVVKKKSIDPANLVAVSSTTNQHHHAASSMLSEENGCKNYKKFTKQRFVKVMPTSSRSAA